MTPAMSADLETKAIFTVRVIGLSFLLAGMYFFAVHSIENYRSFNPIYWDFFVMTQLLRPLFLILWGIGLLVLCRPIGRWLSHGLKS
jgi:hypothetical protein